MLQKLEPRVGVNMLLLASQSKRLPLRISCSSLAPLLLSSSSSATPPLPQLLTKRPVFLPEGGTRLSEKSELKLKPGCQFVTSLPPLSYLCSCLKPWSRQRSCTPPLPPPLLPLPPLPPSTPAVTVLALNLLISQICRQPVFFGARTLRKWLNATFRCLNIVSHSSELTAVVSF